MDSLIFTKKSTADDITTPVRSISSVFEEYGHIFTNEVKSGETNLFPTPTDSKGHVHFNNDRSELSNQDLESYLDNRFYTRIRKIKIQLTHEGFLFIRNFIRKYSTLTIYDPREDHNALLTNRAIMEHMIELIDKFNRKMANLKPEMSVTFTIPQAWAFTEIYSSIDTATMDPYIFATIQPIINQFNQQLL